jgi:hypothetical protein
LLAPLALDVRAARDPLGALDALRTALEAPWRAEAARGVDVVDEALRALPPGDTVDDDALAAFVAAVRPWADVLRVPSTTSQRVLRRFAPSLRAMLGALPTPERHFLWCRLAGVDALLEDVVDDANAAELARVNAARVLGLRRARSAVALLERLEHDDERVAPWLRETAREALERITGVLRPVVRGSERAGTLHRVVIENHAVRSFENVRVGDAVWLPAAPDPKTVNDRRRRLLLADEGRLVVGVDVAGVLYEHEFDLRGTKPRVLAGLTLHPGRSPITVTLLGDDDRKDGWMAPAVVVLPTMPEHDA